MERKCFESVASLVDAVKPKEGLQLKYSGSGKDLTVNYNNKVSSFQGKFTLEPGVVEIGTSPLSVKICPSVPVLGGKLSVDPLDAGSFEFEMDQKILCTKFHYKFVSNTAESVLTLKPEGSYKGAKWNAEVECKKDVKCPAFKTCVEFRGLTFRTNFTNGEKKQFRMAAFCSTPCKCTAFGVGTGFSEFSKPGDLFLMAKGSFKGVTLSTIVNMLKDGVRNFDAQVRCEYEKKCDCKTLKVGVVAARTDGKLSMKEGCSYQCSKCNALMEARLDNEKRNLVVSMKKSGANWFFLPKVDMKSILTFENLAFSSEALKPKVGFELTIKE